MTAHDDERDAPVTRRLVELDDPAASHLDRSVGFESVGQTDLFAGRVAST